jgi:hypothetical protein
MRPPGATSSQDLLWKKRLQLVTQVDRKPSRAHLRNKSIREKTERDNIFCLLLLSLGHDV